MIKIKRYLSNDDGNVAMMFSACIVLLMTGIAVAVDYANMNKITTSLQGQVDAAVLAAARAYVSEVGEEDNPEEESIRLEAALNVMKANGFDDSKIAPEMIFNTSSIVYSAQVEYKPFFGKFLGKEKVTLNALAESGLGEMKGLDIALVLDNTESMSFEGKMTALQEGAIALIDAIEESESESKIAIVPFARYVRIDESLKTKSWFQMPVEYDTERTWEQATHTGGSCITVTKTRMIDGFEQEFETEECIGQTTTYETRTRTIESRWDKCLGTRLPPYSEQDGSYVHKIPGLLNIVPKEFSGLTRDIKTWCPAEIVPLDDDYAMLRNSINYLWPTDYTYIPSGLIWGERVLSPGEPFDNQDGVNKRQVMILMTDGNNTTEIKATNSDFYNAPPYVAGVDQDKIATDANATTTRLCERLKTKGVEIYTIAFRVTDTATKNLLRDCATDPSMSYTADSNAALVNDFKKISKSLEEDIRLIR